MKVKFSTNFYYLLSETVDFIACDKPFAAKKFKKDLIFALKKDLQQPFHYKKSLYFNDESYRDYVFKGYTISCQVSDDEQFVNIFGIIKNKFSY